MKFELAREEDCEQPDAPPLIYLLDPDYLPRSGDRVRSKCHIAASFPRMFILMGIGK